MSVTKFKSFMVRAVLLMHTLEVYINDQEPTKTITFNQAIIAVGSRPYRPEILDFDHPRVFDS